MSSPLDSGVSRPSSGMASPLQRMPSLSRRQSISSDRASTVAHSLMLSPLAVSPEAAFIAASAASQIVTNDHDSHAETWYDQHGIEPSGEAAAVSPAALQLVNSFLDQLLFNFLSVSRSTSLSGLRPAVSDVLKPKLAKDAINQADEELREYLGGDDEDGAQSPECDPVSPTDWDLELAWKRTRLRCMVYSSLGDMEEEDEDYYMEQGHLDPGSEDCLSEAVSPAVAIFLTSILEFLGEQALIVAGQAAYHRMRLKYDKELKEGARSPTGIADKIVVEELDMERVALDRTLGRLWRGWKKKIRSPGAGSMDRLARSYSENSMRAAFGGHLRSPSSLAELAVPPTVPEPDAETKTVDNDPTNRIEALPEHLEEHVVAAGIPLPLGPNDVAEIEVPGLAFCSDDESEDDDIEELTRPARPKSLIMLPLSAASEQLVPQAPDSGPRKRSNSLPVPAPTRRVLAVKTQPNEPSDIGSDDKPRAESREMARDNAVVATNAGEEDGLTRCPESASAQRPEEHDMKDDDDDVISIEEPRIVRSSRVSILGQSTSPTSSEHGKPIAINTNLPVRTPSIHSARLIEVTGPRSPVAGSRRNSVGVSESARRHSSPSRTSRTGTPLVSEDLSGQASESIPVGRLSANHASKSGLAASLSISETEEAADMEYAVSPITPVTPASQQGGNPPTVSEPVSREQYESTQASLRNRIPEPSTPPKPATSKVTILPATASPASTASTTSGTFFIESMPVLPECVEPEEHHRADDHRYRSSPPRQAPVVPERSSGRQAVANTSAHRQPATIGQVPVERSPARSPSESSSSRPYESVTAPARQQHSSGSPSSTKLKAVRTSEEGMHARIDFVRDFEELIQSDQTIQYTLTPENMRDIDPQSQSTRTIATGSPIIPVKTRKSEESRHNGARSRPSSAPRSNDTKAPTSAPRSSGSGSHPVMDGHHVNKNFPTGTGKHGGVVPRSIPPMPSKTRAASGPQAREARLPRESLAEFAEFIRSTGPSGSSTASASASLRPAGARKPASMSSISIEPGRVSTTSNPNRPRLQAREASVDYKNDNSDLIDFIRRGPPSASGNPRIPKAVAPFRTTMDSDQLSGAVGGRAVDAQLRDVDFRSSQVSTIATEYSVPPSIQSSVNSHSALLPRTNPMSYDSVEGDMAMPKRKTRRVRDPYAIDFSDEELDEEEDAASNTQRVQTNEESLIDFLNNYPPPPEPTVQPLNVSQARNKPKKKASAPSLMARFTRRDSGQAGNGRPSSIRTPQPPAAPRSLSSRASSGRGGHIPIQVNIPSGVVDQYAPPTRGSYPKASAMMGGGPAPAGGRVPMKKFEPREAISVSTRTTSDLAEFLKHSGPPPALSPMVNQFPGPVEREETNNGLSKVFGRRRKASIS